MSLGFIGNIIILNDFSNSTDYLTYLSRFSEISNQTLMEVIIDGPFETLFRFLSWLLLLFLNPDETHSFFVVLINAIIFISFYRFFGKRFYSIICLLIYIHTPFLDISGNIVRQSLTLALILFIFTLKNSYIKNIMVISLPFIHLSSLPITVYLMFNKFISNQFITVLYIISICLFLTSLNSVFFSDLALISNYTEIETFKAYGSSGNRLDFFTVTLILTLTSVFLFNKKIINNEFFYYFIIASSYFYLMGFQAFSDRYAIYIWYFIPVITSLVLYYLLEKGRVNYDNNFS